MGRPITYADLVRQALTLNEAKQGPLRLEHGRYINFISDFLAANGQASRQQAIEAWHELKAMDVPKTYQAWVQAPRKSDRTPGATASSNLQVEGHRARLVSWPRMAARNASGRGVKVFSPPVTSATQ
jgi:hypothetical protein